MATNARSSAVAQDFQLLPVKQFAAELLATDPTGVGLAQGRQWLNTTTGLLKYVADASGTVVTLQAGGSGLTQEQVEDIVAAMESGAHTGLTVTYTDNGTGAGTISYAVTDSPLLAGATLAQVRDFAATTGQRAMGSAISDAPAYVDGRAQTIADATRDSILGGASAAYDTLQELQALMEADDTEAANLATAVAGKVRTLAAATLAAGTVTATVTHAFSTRDVMCSARYDDGDYEDVDIIVERPTTGSMVLRWSTQTRPIRVMPYSLV